MHVVVTGGAGFIGANLVRDLVKDGHRPVVVDDFSTGYRANLDGIDVDLIEASILDRRSLDEALDGADAIVHLAARPSVSRSLADPLATNDANVNGTLLVLEAARRHGSPHVIVASSSSVYGNNPALPKREDLVPMPASPYAVSKLAAESYALAYASCFELNVLVFRFFNVYGPFQQAGHAYAAVIPAFVSAALADNPLVIHGDGTQTRDFTYVGSVTAVLLEALTARAATARPVNLAFGDRVSLLTLANELEAVLHRSIPREHGEPRLGDVHDSQADNRKLLELFPDAQKVPLRDGLEATVAWHRSAANIARSVTTPGP